MLKTSQEHEWRSSGGKLEGRTNKVSRDVKGIMVLKPGSCRKILGKKATYKQWQSTKSVQDYEVYKKANVRVKKTVVLAKGKAYEE